MSGLAVVRSIGTARSLRSVEELEDVGQDGWLSTTTRYIHVHADHIESAWANANQRVAARLEER